MTGRFRSVYQVCISLTLALIVAACASVGNKDATQQVIKSENDKRTYRYLTLKNGMPVLLVHDADTKFSAASLDVFVGSGMDPKDRAGLAHFLEHMLFLGTKKFPNPGEYQAFIKANGGQHNAYTAMEHTNYFFNIKSGALPQALDRFSQFFISPLLTEDYVEREKNAVNSEYQARIKDEGRRKADVLRELVNQDHPFAKFSVGSLKTLSSESRPIREDLLAFYQKYYSAKNMRLVVYDKRSLDELEALVKKDFDAVPSFDVPDNHISDPLFDKGTLPEWVNIKPEKQVRELSILFPMPDYQKDYRSKPVMVLGHILGHEGAGSLYAYLKKKNWIESLSAGGGLSYQGGSVFSLTVELTDEGLQHQQDIVVAVFQAIKRLKEQGIPKWVFTELADINQLNFDYQEQTSPLGYVVGLSNAMQYFPAKDVLRADYMMDEYRPDLIKQALGYLNINNALIMVVADGFTSVETSKYYSTPYTVANLPGSLKTAIADASISPEIVLPQPNNLLPTNLDLIEPLEPQTLPREIAEGERLSVWYKPLDEFQTPRSSNYYSFQKDGLNKTPIESVALDMYVKMINDGLTDLLYPAYLAGLSFDFYVHARGVSLKIDGFSDRQSDLLAEIANKIQHAEFTEMQFKRVRDESVRKVKNAVLAPPYRKAMSEWQQLMRPQLWSYEETLAALNKLTLNDVEKAGKAFWHDAYLQALSNGNLSKEQAINNALAMQSALQKGDTFDAHPPVRVREVPAHRYYHHVETPYRDSGYLLYWQGGGVDAKAQAEWLLLSKSLEAGYFNSLRTEQQLGYVVFANYYPLLTVPGITFVVQSPVANVAHIHEATLGYLDLWSRAVEVLDEATFEQYRSSVVKRLREEPENLDAESGRYWNDLALGFTGFDRREELARAVESLSLAEWKTFVASAYKSFPQHTVLLGTENAEEAQKVLGKFRTLPGKSDEGTQYFEYPKVIEKARDNK